jgi:hypothetical protein
MISGARRPKARCAVSDRRLAEATAARKVRSAAHRAAVGGVAQPSAMAALVAMESRAHERGPWFGLSIRYFKKATVPGRAWEWAAQKHLRVGKAPAFASGQKPPSPTRRKKRQRRSPCDASRQIYFTAWVACAREMMAPPFLVAIDQCGE